MGISAGGVRGPGWVSHDKRFVEHGMIDQAAEVGRRCNGDMYEKYAVVGGGNNGALSP